MPVLHEECAPLDIDRFDVGDVYVDTTLHSPYAPAMGAGSRMLIRRRSPDNGNPPLCVRVASAKIAGSVSSYGKLTASIYSERLSDVHLQLEGLLGGVLSHVREAYRTTGDSVSCTTRIDFRWPSGHFDGTDRSCPFPGIGAEVDAIMTPYVLLKRCVVSIAWEAVFIRASQDPSDILSDSP